MKKLFLPLFIGLLLYVETFSQTRDNFFPESGNVGIGVGGKNTASQKLEVIGNAKISGTIFTGSLETTLLKANSLSIAQDASIGRNLLIQGNVGINVASPVERLEVGGNLRVTNSIFADQATFNSSFKVGAKFAINGLTGDLSAANATFGGNIIGNQNLILNGLLGVGVATPSEKVDVLGNIKASGNLLSLSLQTGSAQLTSLSVGQNSIFNGLVGIGVVSPLEKLHVAGNIKADNNLFANAVVVSSVQTATLNSGTAIFTDRVTLQNDLLVNGKIGVGLTNPSEKFEVIGNIKSSQNVIADGATFNNGTINQNFSVGGSLSLNGNLEMRGIFKVKSLDVTDITTSSDAILGRNLSVGGNSELKGDLTVTGKINAGVIEATEFRSATGSAPFNFENAVISQSLIIGANRAIPSNYKLAVGGYVIATGIDIKIPQKWPDYVFTKEYGLISLAELEAFIKQHGHLPSVPSAAEMSEKQNYSVAEMDAKLLEKIEELSLYLIQLKKELQVQGEELKNLKERKN
jgi:hypothetical protein